MSDWTKVLERAESLLERLESHLPVKLENPDWKQIVACRWRCYGGRGFLQPVSIPDHIKVRDLSAIDEQIKLVDMNTRQFIAGLPANNVLLTGSKGTGKSSLIKALLNKYSKKIDPPWPPRRYVSSAQKKLQHQEWNPIKQSFPKTFLHTT